MQISELIKLKGQLKITLWNNSGLLDIAVMTGEGKEGDIYTEEQIRMPFTDEQVSVALDKMVFRIIEKINKDANSL